IGESLRLQDCRVQVRATDQRASAAAVADDFLNLPRVVTQAGESRWDRRIDDLEIAAAGQLLEFDQRKIRLDARGIAIHHQADGTRWSDYSDLGVAVPMLLA